MSAVANIVLADAQATPVNHTFIPLGPDSNGAWWFEDQSQASPVGYWKISLQLVRNGPVSAGSTASDRTSRVKVTLHEPVLETVTNSSTGLTPAPTVAFVPRCTTEYIMSERSSLQNRKDLRKMNSLLQSEAQLVAMVENLQNIW
ncbi:MAG: hypothetical protein [Sanya fiers-like virus 8]|nr:MAG: hypothetical protein [Sanya fiers-like virus 8]UUW21229.1 MAG: hypothetical protein [Sanya fiers-like virus 8]